jgi:hypothetical protein
MPYPEMDNRTQTRLALIARRAREEPTVRFTSLAHLRNEGFLTACYYRLGRDRASGIDGVRWNTARVRDGRPILQAKLQGHYPYYGVSGSSRAIRRYGYIATGLVLKWLHRRSQKASFTWTGFLAYLRHYRLPRPRIVHRLYPSPLRG